MVVAVVVVAEEAVAKIVEVEVATATAVAVAVEKIDDPQEAGVAAAPTPADPVAARRFHEIRLASLTGLSDKSYSSRQSF